MDWNSDGLKDLLVGENNGQVRYYRNIGSVGNPQLTAQGTILVAGSPIDIGDYSQPWVNDWNEDAKKDLMVGASDGRVYLYINVGTNASPVFNTTQWVTLATGGQLDFGSRSGPVVMDMNGDGVKDLLSGEVSGKVYFCENNGTNANPQLANFVALKTGTIDISHGSTSRIAVSDWDQDGTQDVMSGGYDSRLRLYLQAAATTPPAPVVDLVNNGGYYIPASGGRLNYTFTATNQSGSTVTFDAWSEVQLPNDNFYGPILSRPDLSLGPYGILTCNLAQDVPGTAPGGYYYYYGYAGVESLLQIYSSDYIYFYKLGGDGEGGIGDWNLSGWMEEDNSQALAHMPDRITLSSAPNPFNPVTTLEFDLPNAENTSLAVYNANGQQVASLVEGYRDAGRHQVTWDASALSSGVYFVSVKAGTFEQTLKVLLTK